MKRIPGILVILIFILNTVSCRADRMETKDLVVGDAALIVEIADTPEARKTGLMNRESLDYGRGMLFVFEREQKLSFWMKNTSIPLSIAYISKSGVIREIHPLEPFSQSPVYSQHSVLYALEVNRGWFGEQGVSVGDRIQFSP
jgi:uncharacterized membrane protein (UPF0127 family)